jgi:nitrogen regulatory protein P-II 1
MKLIVAVIRENQLERIRESLVKAGISRITVGNVSGHGRRVTEEVYRGQKVVPNLVSNIRLEIAVNDDYVNTAVDAIMSAAQSYDEDLIGSGKIFIMPLDDVIRIRTGERGPDAI